MARVQVRHSRNKDTIHSYMVQLALITSNHEGLTRAEVEAAAVMRISLTREIRREHTRMAVAEEAAGEPNRKDTVAFITVPISVIFI